MPLSGSSAGWGFIQLQAVKPVTSSSDFFVPLLFPRPVNDSANTEALELVLKIPANYHGTCRYGCKSGGWFLKTSLCVDANLGCLVHITDKSVTV